MAPLDDSMESSRVFVKGLPPNLSEGEFKKFFSSQRDITDAKLIPHRRIGYVGYKSPADAAYAVKYFNKSFIRMSRLAVELARPILVSETNHARGKEPPEAYKLGAHTFPDSVSHEAHKISTKRKRDDASQASPEDPKLREFLDVMRPRSKTTKRGVETVQDLPDTSQNNDQSQLNEVEDLGGSRGSLSTPPRPRSPKRSERLSPPKEVNANQKRPVEPSEAAPNPVEVVVADEGNLGDQSELRASDSQGATNASDADWLRSRTSRLLGLVDDDDEEDEGTPANPDTLVEDSETEVEETGEASPAIVNDGIQARGDAPEDAAVPEYSRIADGNLEQIRESGRLFVRNLPYSATEGDLLQHFSPLGKLSEIHVPLSSAGPNKGFAYLLFEDPMIAAQVYEQENGKAFQGRLIHILPANAKKETKLADFALSKLPLKKQKQIKKKADAATSTFNWNSMYMNADAVISSVADRLGVPKSDLLDPTSSDAAVKQAHAETHIIQGTKQYFAANGVDLDAFKRRERGDTAILVKNFPHGTKAEELKTLFEQHGEVKRILMPPNGVIAIVEFIQDVPARSAFASLSYRRFKDSVLFLEKGPKDVFTGKRAANVATTGSDSGKQAKISGSEVMSGHADDEALESTTLFVRNLSFATTTDRLAQEFKPLQGFLSARVKTKPDPKHAGNTLSMGFGFLEFRTKAQAQAALSTMNGHTLDGHSLVVRSSHRGLDAGEERKKEDRAKKDAQRKTKIIIKNLPFEASKKEVRALFGSYGQLRSIRLPKKFDNSARGFAFADYVTVREAENAMNSLRDTHLLGRRLVLEFASEDPVDAEEEIEKMQKKVGGQVNKVALQRLTGSGRRKFNVEGDDTNG